MRHLLREIRGVPCHGGILKVPRASQAGPGYIQAVLMDWGMTIASKGQEADEIGSQAIGLVCFFEAHRRLA